MSMNNERYCVRLTPDLRALLRARAREHEMTPSEIFREALTMYLYGGNEPDAAYRQGYAQGRRVMMTMANAIVTHGLQSIPDDPYEAQEWAHAVLYKARLRSMELNGEVPVHDPNR